MSLIIRCKKCNKKIPNQPVIVEIYSGELLYCDACFVNIKKVGTCHLCGDIIKNDGWGTWLTNPEEKIYKLSCPSRQCQRLTKKQQTKLNKGAKVEDIIDGGISLENIKKISTCQVCKKICTLKCPCENANYCSKECQNQDWNNHKQTCNVKKKCNLCKKDSTLTCSHCKNIYYCSKECQNLNWTEHKDVCKK